MSYIGNSPAPFFTAVTTDVFSANGTGTDFTLSRRISNLADIEVIVDNIQQNPFSGSYSVSGDTLSFSSAPSSGSNNVTVTYRQATIGSTIPTPNTVGNNALRSDLSLTGNTTTQHILPSANVTYDIGSDTMRYRDLYLSGNTIQLGAVSLSTSNETFVVANTTGGVLPSELGNTTITGTLTANDTTIVGSANVTGVLAAGNTTVTGSLTANNTNIVGTANVSGILSTGNTTITGSANVTGILSANLITANTSQAWHQAAKGTHILRAADFGAAISANTTALKIFPATNLDSGASRPVDSYWGGISFMMLDPEIFGSSYTGSQIWIGAKVVDNPGQERSSFVIATNSSPTAGTQPIERFKVDPFGRVTSPYQPAFYATKNETLNESSFVGGAVIPSWLASLNVGGHFSNSSGRFVSPVAGSYLLALNVMHSGQTDGDVQYRWYKNGSYYAGSNDTNNGAAWSQTTVVVVMYLDANDYAEPYAYTGVSSSQVLVYGGAYSHVSGYLIG